MHILPTLLFILLTLGPATSLAKSQLHRRFRESKNDPQLLAAALSMRDAYLANPASFHPLVQRAPAPIQPLARQARLSIPDEDGSAVPHISNSLRPRARSRTPGHNMHNTHAYFQDGPNLPEPARALFQGSPVAAPAQAHQPAAEIPAQGLWEIKCEDHEFNHRDSLLGVQGNQCEHYYSCFANELTQVRGDYDFFINRLCMQKCQCHRGGH